MKLSERKAILAELPDPMCEEFLRALPLPRRTQRTLTDLPWLHDELEVTRARRFAIDDEENEDDIRCVGSSFLDHYGAVVGAVSVSAPVFTLSVADAIVLGSEVLKAATTVSRALGVPSAQVRVSLRREDGLGAES
jgi:DNA-binding IclR family transcriptional regulator